MKGSILPSLPSSFSLLWSFYFPPDFTYLSSSFLFSSLLFTFFVLPTYGHHNNPSSFFASPPLRDIGGKAMMHLIPHFDLATIIVRTCREVPTFGSCFICFHPFNFHKYRMSLPLLLCVDCVLFLWRPKFWLTLDLWTTCANTLKIYLCMLRIDCLILAVFFFFFGLLFFLLLKTPANNSSSLSSRMNAIKFFFSLFYKNKREDKRGWRKQNL